MHQKMGASPSIEHACTERLPRDVLKIIASKYAMRYYMNSDYEWVKNADYTINNIDTLQIYEYPKFEDNTILFYNSTILCPSVRINSNLAIVYVSSRINLLINYEYKLKLGDKYLILFKNKQKHHRLIKIGLMILYKHLAKDIEFKEFINMQLVETCFTFYRNRRTIKDILELKL